MTAERDFVPTSNARNEKMFEEATRFEAQLRLFERDLKLWQKDVDETFKNLKVMMLSPLPRVYDVDPEGRARAVGDEYLIGGNIDPNSISAAAVEVKQRLDLEVLKPIKDWTLAYNIIKDYMKKLEELRLTLDSRRRTARNLENKLDRAKSTGNVQQHEMDEMESRVRHKQEKMMSDQKQYTEKEQQLYSSLSSLIQDTSVLKEYAAAAVLIMRECFDRAYGAFDHVTREKYPPLQVPELHAMPASQEKKSLKSVVTGARNWSFMDRNKSTIGTNPQPDVPTAADQLAYEQYPAPAYPVPESPYGNRNYQFANPSPAFGYQ